jgi:3-dehydroquinate synthase
VETARQRYPAVVERGILSRVGEHLPERTGKIFITTTEDVWALHGEKLVGGLAGRSHQVLFFPAGESNKRFAPIEVLAENMLQSGADRSSLILAFGGGIVNDMGGFFASIFMRGIRVVQIPTTLLAQVDAAIGGKTGVNLVAGKNLIGAFHQPLAVLIDPEVLRTLPEREYRAGLYEVIKYGVIASPDLFALLTERPLDVFGQTAEVVDHIISESVRIKAEVVSADERESDLRRILNFGHTIGHALEAETAYTRFLHGEAVAFGMKAATHLSSIVGLLGPADSGTILSAIEAYGPIPQLDGITADRLAARLKSDKKTIQGNIHFVLPDRIGHTLVRSGIAPDAVVEAIEAALG